MNQNKVFIIGRATIDPVVKATPSGSQVTSFSVATNRIWNDKSGNRKEDTEFHNVVVWGKQADVCGRFLKKGGLIMIEGRLQSRVWENKAGQKIKTTEIICEKLQFGPKLSGTSYTPDKEEVAKEVENGEAEEVKEEDLPF